MMKRFLKQWLPRKNLDELYLFVHLPKCAGTSLLKMLSKIGTQRFVVVAETQTKKDALQLLNSNIEKQNIDIGQLDVIAGRNIYYGMHLPFPRPPFYFTFLRDPIERFISHYSYLAKCATDQRNPSYSMASKRIVSDGRIISIQEFVEQEKGRDILTRTLAAASSDEESGDSWWHPNPKTAADKAKWLLQQMRFIGFVDQFEADARFILDKLKLAPKLQKINVSDSRRLQVDPDTLKKIRSLNELDLEIYDFAKTIAANHRGNGLDSTQPSGLGPSTRR